MPAVTYLHDWEVAEGRQVLEDPECNELLQEFRNVTCRDWIIRVHVITEKRFMRKDRQHRLYTLYNDCHGEWQVMNMVTPPGATTEYYECWHQSRQAVMNYMLGFMAGIDDERKYQKAIQEKDDTV